MSEKCSASVIGLVCKNGFIQSAICHGLQSGCTSCGTAEKPPQCLRDKMPAHQINDAGYPKWVKQAATHGIGAAK